MVAPLLNQATSAVSQTVNAVAPTINSTVTSVTMPLATAVNVTTAPVVAIVNSTVVSVITQQINQSVVIPPTGNLTASLLNATSQIANQVLDQTTTQLARITSSVSLAGNLSDDLALVQQTYQTYTANLLSEVMSLQSQTENTMQLISYAYANATLGLSNQAILFANQTGALLTAQLGNVGVLSGSLLNNTQNITGQLLDNVQSVVSGIRLDQSRKLILEYVGLGCTITGVVLISGAEVFRDNRKIRGVCSIAGMALTAFGVSQLFELKA